MKTVEFVGNNSKIIHVPESIYNAIQKKANVTSTYVTDDNKLRIEFKPKKGLPKTRGYMILNDVGPNGVNLKETLKAKKNGANGRKDKSAN